MLIELMLPVHEASASTLTTMYSLDPADSTPKVALFVALSEESREPSKHPLPSEVAPVAKATARSIHPVSKPALVVGSFIRTLILLPVKDVELLTIVPVPSMVKEKLDFEPPELFWKYL